MFKPTLDLIAQQFSGERAMRHVEEIVRYHRIQASPGMRAAAGYCYDHFTKLGLSAEIMRFAGNGKTRYWTELMPPEWSCDAATLRLVSPADKADLLADFAEHKLSIIQRSAPTPPGGVEAEVVILDPGTEDKDYDGVDVRGKLVLTKGDLRRVHDLAVQRRGALGIIYDGMREQPPVRPIFDLADALQYTSFWWRPEDTRCFGFVLSPRRGEELRRTVRAAAAHGESVRLHAQVESSFRDGFIDIASGLLRGETDEEVLVVAHLCHPQPSANDNASGVATVLETARVLQALILGGSLPRPRRSIRFLLPPEMSGTYAYLAGDARRAARTVAAINLDMVGESQDVCGSSFLVESPPQAMAAPVDVLAVAIQETLAQEQHGLNDLGTFALFRYGHTPFNGGSDHYVLSDPTVGIACPMIIEWPDRFYHTSMDTVDKVDPASLTRAGLLTAAYAAFLAAAGADEAAWLAYEAQTRYKAAIGRDAQDAGTRVRTLGADGAAMAAELARLKSRLLYCADRQQAALGWLERLGGADVTSIVHALQSEAAGAAWNEWTAQCELAEGIAARRGLRRLPDAPERALDEWDTAAQQIVPVRRLPGPIELHQYLAGLPPEVRDDGYAVTQQHRGTPEALLALALYWADGVRTLYDIAHLVEMETGVRDVEYLVRYVRLLRRLNLA